MNTIACSIIRGGSSKGVFFDERHLPLDARERDRLLLSVMGSPDPRQVDGLGGGDPLTSKVAIIAPGQVGGADLEYESVEVGLGSEVVNRGIMCGNLASGVALFASGAGMLPTQALQGDIRIHCRSNGKFIVARRLDGRPWTDGAQTAGGATDIALRFEDPAGAVTGRLLPLGQALSQFTVDGTVMTASVTDAGTLYAFVHAQELGCQGNEAPAELDANGPLRERVESLRRAVMFQVNATLGTTFAAARLKVAMVSAARRDGQDRGAESENESEGEGTLTVRILNPAKVHKACAVSGGICLAAAAAVPGSVIHTLVRAAGPSWVLRIKHPTGVLPVTLHREGERLLACEVRRSARVLMQGTAALGLSVPSLHAQTL
jgi:2-methylaconitate cis-trans-isomerase PrpF